MSDTGKIEGTLLAATPTKSARVRLRVTPVPARPPLGRDYPFTRSELMAGLRRYLADGTLRLLDVTPIPLSHFRPSSSFHDAGTRLRAFSCVVLSEGDEHSLSVILKEPPITSQGRVLTGVGQREYGVYAQLAAHLDRVLVPGLIAGSEEDGWIILEALSGLRPPEEWTPDDYREAILNLTAMHDRFYGCGEDLSVFPWLARPFDADFQETVDAAVEAVAALTLGDTPPHELDKRTVDLLYLLAGSVDAIVAPLRAETFTLVHGDYWPGNIGRQIDGRQLVFDWQLAAVGPAILDLVGFVQAVSMRLNPSLALADIVMLYRETYNRLLRPGWDDAAFALLWDHALMWRFVANWLEKLATMPREDFRQLYDSFRAVWLEPVLAAAARRL